MQWKLDTSLYYGMRTVVGQANWTIIVPNASLHSQIFKLVKTPTQTGYGTRPSLKWRSHAYMGPETKNSPYSINTSSSGENFRGKDNDPSPPHLTAGEVMLRQTAIPLRLGLVNNVCPSNPKGRWKYFLLIWSVFEERKIHLPNWPIKSEMRIYLRSAGLGKIWAIYFLRLSFLNPWKN